MSIIIGIIVIVVVLFLLRSLFDFLFGFIGILFILALGFAGYVLLKNGNLWGLALIAVDLIIIFKD